ncbi:hypothetical protein [Fournierella massiliensis]|uniref:hypothetical protein n=1 Tax=Allofournierella massiliensis TaxID=1650663 RepID=UPI003520B6A6
MLSKTVTKRLAHEVKAALAKHDMRGQSKHAAKQAARAEAQRTHTSYTQITGLYATSSYATYQKQALTALHWIAERYGCKRLDECRPYLSAYYAEMQARGLSAWTIRTRVYALCSVYDADYAALFGIERLPARHRADIKRGRQMSAADARHHTPEQEAVRTIARACGARRGGIIGLTAEDLIARDGRLYIHLKEKGGKEREAIVLPAYEAAVQEIFTTYARNPKAAETGGKQRLFCRSALPKDMPLHYLRAQYAQDLYRYYGAQGAASGRLYHCRADRKGKFYDKGVLMAVSHNLGHSRCDVVVSHYL